MAKALEYPVVFKALLDGGYITSTHYVQRKTEYKVFQKTERTARMVGHITEKQFDALVAQRVIKPTSQNRDKWGNIINFYELGQRDNVIRQLELAVADLKTVADCGLCKYGTAEFCDQCEANDYSCNSCTEKCPCKQCSDGSEFVYRVQDVDKRYVRKEMING